VKLNLGCGDKILPGYVNVDVAPARAGQKPDVICDLHRLEPFQDAAADEILAVPASSFCATRNRSPGLAPKASAPCGCSTATRAGATR
jgi:hypothetical protein